MRERTAHFQPGGGQPPQPGQKKRVSVKNFGRTTFSCLGSPKQIRLKQLMRSGCSKSDLPQAARLPLRVSAAQLPPQQASLPRVEKHTRTTWVDRVTNQLLGG